MSSCYNGRLRFNKPLGGAMVYINDIINEMNNRIPASKARLLRMLLPIIKENNKQQEVAEAIFTTVTVGIFRGFPLTTICDKTIVLISKICGVNLHSYTNRERVSTGIQMVDYMGAYITPKVTEGMKVDKSVATRTMLIATDPDLVRYINDIEIEDYEIDPTTGPKVWTGFHLNVDGKRLEFVKKARRYNLQHLYTYDQIPGIYDAVNQLQQTGFKINKWILEVAKSGHIFNPPTIDNEVKTNALRAIGRMKTKAIINNSLNNSRGIWMVC